MIKILVLFLIATISSTSYSSDVIKSFQYNPDGPSKIKVCSRSFTPDEKFKVRVGENGLDQSGRINDKNCALKTYTKGIINRDMKIIFTISGSKYIVTKYDKGSTDAQLKPLLEVRYNKSDEKVFFKYCNTGLVKSSRTSTLIVMRRGEKVAYAYAHAMKVDGRRCLRAKFSHDEKGLLAGDSVEISNPDGIKITVPVRQITGAPVTPPPVYPPIDPPLDKPNYDVNAAQSQGRRSAEAFLNAMLEGHGTLEHLRYNLFLGINDAKRGYQHLAQGKVNNLQEYKSAKSESETRGRLPGYTAGQNHALLRATEDATDRVDQQFRQAVGTGSLPTPNNFTNNAPFDGLNGPKHQPESLTHRLGSQTNFLVEKVRHRLSWDSCLVMGSDHYRKAFNLGSIYELQGRYNSELSIPYRGEEAFLAWRNNKVTRCSSFDEFHRMRSSEYSNHEEAYRTFKRSFLRYYERNIYHNWKEKTQNSNEPIIRIGEEIFWESLRSFAIDKGSVDGYNLSFYNGSFGGFEENYVSLFQNKYDNIYLNRAEHSNVQMPILTLIAGDKSTARYPGQYFNLIVRGVENRGGKSASLKIEFFGQGLATTEEEHLIEIPALTKVKENIVYENVAMIPMTVKSGQNLRLRVKLGGYEKTFNLQVNFEDIVIAYSHAGEQNLLNTIVRELSEDWETHAGAFKNDFDMRVVDTKIETFFGLLDQMTDGEQAIFRQNKRRLRTIYPKRRPGWLSTSRGDWSDVNELFDEFNLL